MTWPAAAKLVIDQTGFAVAAALFFGAGALTAVPVVRHRVRFLLALPRWFAGLIQRVLQSNPSAVSLGLFIFAFNGTAIFIYMLTGLVPGLPPIVAFLTGLNVMAAGMMGQADLASARIRKDVPLSAQCGVLTFLLELPCFWYAIALGGTFPVTLWGLFGGESVEPLQERVLAYAMVILPVLAVSAFVEAHAVTAAFGRGDG
jgi:hypothetical protein